MQKSTDWDFPLSNYYVEGAKALRNHADNFHSTIKLIFTTIYLNKQHGGEQSQAHKLCENVTEFATKVLFVYCVRQVYEYPVSNAKVIEKKSSNHQQKYTIMPENHSRKTFQDNFPETQAHFQQNSPLYKSCHNQ